jgi:hypothetical protein
MKRREILGLLGAGGGTALSGCLSPPVAPSSTVSDGIQRRISLAGQNSIPDELQVSITAEMLESTVTDEHPARVRITMTNQGDERRFSGCAVFDRESKGSIPPELWLESDLDDSVRTGKNGSNRTSRGPERALVVKGVGWKCMPPANQS